MANKELYIKYIRVITLPIVKAFFYAALFLIFIGDIVIDFITFVLKTVANVLLFLPRKANHIPYKIKYFILGIGITLLVFFVYQSYIFVKTLPTPKLIGTLNYSVSTKILDRNGSLLYEIFHDQNRTPVKIDSLPKYVSQATIAIEDQAFYEHPGISLYGGILRASKEMLFDRSLQGGSTITQQLVKSALLTPERTITRKVKEAILAIWTEHMYTKKQILEMYLNQVPYGGSSYGIEKASQTFFDKSSHDLTIAQAAFLAGLPQAPSLYSPYSNPKYALDRRNDVLKKMSELDFINKKQYQSALQEPLTIKSPTQYIRAPHFVFYVKSVLEKMYGIARVEAGGLRVVTSLDLKTQEQTENILSDEIAKIEYWRSGFTRRRRARRR